MKKLLFTLVVALSIVSCENIDGDKIEKFVRINNWRETPIWIQINGGELKRLMHNEKYLNNQLPLAQGRKPIMVLFESTGIEEITFYDQDKKTVLETYKGCFYEGDVNTRDFFNISCWNKLNDASYYPHGYYFIIK